LDGGVQLLRRVLSVLLVAIAAVFVVVNWIAPVALSFYAAQKAPTVASVVPVDLKDKSISQAPGEKLSFLGYEFEVPWSDLDEGRTKFYPKDKPEKTKVDLRFHSGLRLVLAAHPTRRWAKDLSADFDVSPQIIESTFTPEAVKSDYSFFNTVYGFTPDHMNHWSASQGAHDREELMLAIKSTSLRKAAETGIFNLRNQNFKGFQQGNPRVRQDEIVVDLYSSEGSLEMTFFQADYPNYVGVTQAEINRIVQSLRKATQSETPALQTIKNPEQRTGN
jgi:hypothetical protein